jgi:hypothetical protein
MDQHHALIFTRNCQLVASESPILYRTQKEQSEEAYLQSWFGKRYLGYGLVKCAYCFMPHVMKHDADDVCDYCKEVNNG